MYLILTLYFALLVFVASGLDLVGTDFPEEEEGPFIESETVDRGENHFDQLNPSSIPDDAHLPYNIHPSSDGYFAYREFQDRCPKLAQDAAALMTDLGMKSRYSAHFQPDFVKMRILPIFETLVNELNAITQLVPDASEEAERTHKFKPGDPHHPASCYFICEELLLRKTRSSSDINSVDSQKLRSWLKAGKLGTSGTEKSFVAASWDSNSRFSYLVSQANLLSLQPNEKQFLDDGLEASPSQQEEEYSKVSSARDGLRRNRPDALSAEEVFAMLDDLSLEGKDTFPSRLQTQEHQKDHDLFVNDPLMQELMGLEPEDRELLLKEEEGPESEENQRIEKKLRRMKFPIPSQQTMKKAEDFHTPASQGKEKDSSFSTLSSWKKSITTFFFGEPENEDDSMEEIERLLKELMGDDFSELNMDDDASHDDTFENEAEDEEE